MGKICSKVCGRGNRQETNLLSENFDVPPPFNTLTNTAVINNTEKEALVRLEIKDLQQKSMDLAETNAAGMSTINQRLPVGSVVRKGECHIQLSCYTTTLESMQLTELQEVYNRVSEEYTTQCQLQEKMYRELCETSKFKDPDVRSGNAPKDLYFLGRNEESWQSQTSKTGPGTEGMLSWGLAWSSKMSEDEILNIQCPFCLLGRDFDYGLQWDSKWSTGTPGPADESIRDKVREGTRQKVAQELGLQGFGQASSKASQMPPSIKQTVLFVDDSRKEELGACAGGEYLLGRYDICCVKVNADYCRQWNFIKGNRRPFWVAHAAAINIGESLKASDFPSFRVEGQNCLDEVRYLEAMGHIHENISKVCVKLDVEHLVTFPFGMRAFLRHLGKVDNQYFEDEKLQRLRRCIARRWAKQLSKAPPNCRIHLCILFTDEEPKRNADAFMRALIDGCAKTVAQRVTIWPEADALQLAHELAKTSQKVLLLNGANRKLLGNHWFGPRAKFAIDENLHRRSWNMSALSYILNGFDGTEKVDRAPDELQKNVSKAGGRVHVL